MQTRADRRRSLNLRLFKMIERRDMRHGARIHLAATGFSGSYAYAYVVAIVPVSSVHPIPIVILLRTPFVFFHFFLVFI